MRRHVTRALASPVLHPRRAGHHVFCSSTASTRISSPVLSNPVQYEHARTCISTVNTYKHARVRTAAAAAARGECRWRRKGSERRLLEVFFLLSSFFLPVSFLITNGAPHHGGEAVEKGGGSAACIWLSSHAVSFPACMQSCDPIQAQERETGTAHRCSSSSCWAYADHLPPD